jgi:hypothetical protein
MSQSSKSGFESEFETEENAQPSGEDPQDRWANQRDAPKRSPMRRKDRARAGGFELKHKRDEKRDEKRDDKRKNSRLKYDW